MTAILKIMTLPCLSEILCDFDEILYSQVGYDDT